MEIAGVKAVHDPPVDPVQHSGPFPHRPIPTPHLLCRSADVLDIAALLGLLPASIGAEGYTVDMILP